MAKKIKIKIKNKLIANGAIEEIQLRLFGLNFFKSKELDTTDIELKAIASPANSGFKIKPNPVNALVAIGMPATLDLLLFNIYYIIFMAFLAILIFNNKFI